MALQVKSTTGVPTVTLPTIVAALKLDPRYVAHLAVDESPKATLLVVVYKDAPAEGTRGAKKAPVKRSKRG
jgi:hypothetical protein